MTEAGVEKSLIGRMIAGTVSLGMFRIASLALGLLTTIVVVRRFSAEDFGTFVLLQVVASFLILFSNLGLNLSVTKFVAATDCQERKRDLVHSAIFLQLVAIIMASLLAWIGKPLLLQLFSASMLSDLIIFVPLLVLLESTRSLLKSILQGFFRFSESGITDLITNSLNLLLLLTVISSPEAGIVGLILARAIAVVGASAFAYISIPVKKKPVLRPDVIKELAKFGLPLQLNDFLFFITSRVDTLVIGALFGASDIAIYEIARKIPDSLRQLYEPFRSVYISFSSRIFSLENGDKSARLLNDSTRLIAFGTTLGAAIALLFGKDIIQLFFSVSYLPSAPIFALLMVNLCFSLVGNVLGISLVTVGDPDKPAVVNAFNSVASFLGTVLLTPAWGVAGAAIGTTFGTMMAFPPLMVFLRKRLDAKVKPYLKPMVVFFAWASLMLLVGPTSFLARFGGIALFLVACVLSSVVTKNDLILLLVGSGMTAWWPVRKLFPWVGRV